MNTKKWKLKHLVLLVALVGCVGLSVAVADSGPKTASRGAKQTQAKSDLTPEQRLSNLHLFNLPPAGIDHLYFEVNDTIEVPGLGEETITLDGTYRIQRSESTSDSWQTAAIDVKMLDLDVQGTSKLFGRVQVRLNPSKETVGKVHGAKGPNKPKPCGFKAYIQMTLPDKGNMVLVNKEPVQLEHMITHIPPIGQGGGNPEGTFYYLYNADNLDGPAVAILNRIRTHIGPWVE